MKDRMTLGHDADVAETAALTLADENAERRMLDELDYETDRKADGGRIGAEKASRLALLYAISENPNEPIIGERALDWAWRTVRHLTARMLYQASVFVHDNEFDALRQKTLRILRDHGGGMNHGMLLRYLHVDADALRRVIDTLIQSELIEAIQSAVKTESGCISASCRRINGCSTIFQ